MLSSPLLYGYIFIAFLMLGLGFVAFLNNTREKTNKSFFIFSIFLLLWMLANYFSNREEIILEYALIANHLVLFFAGCALLYMLKFIFALTERASKKIIYLKSFLFMFYLLALTPFVVEGISWNGQVYEITFGVLSPVYFVALFVNVGAVVYFLVSGLKRAVGRKKRQLSLVFATIAVWLLLTLTTNAILPLFGESFDLTNLGPLTSLVLVAGLAYSIAKQKLFNIRILIIRSLGYVLSMTLLVFLLAAVSLVFTNTLFDEPTSVPQLIVNASLLVVGAVSYPFLKRYFDKVTNKIFYRDAYDPQEFLDQLNKSIVSNIEIGILLRHAVSIIEQNLKSGFVQIVIPKTETTTQRIAGTKDVTYSDHEINYMRGRLVGLGRKIIMVDELNPDEDELRKIMARHDIAVLTHLSATSFGQDQTIAFMIFGTKRSGNMYNKQDEQIISLISDSLVIAIQNALRFEEIQEFNVTLQSKVTAATNKMKRTNEKLKAMDATKDEFISMASHQLRTPLTSVKGYLSMVLEGDAGDINPEQKKLLDQAFVSSQRMVYLIADLLNVSRLRTGKFVIDAHPANLADLIEGEVTQLKGQAEAKNLKLTFKRPDDFPDLVIDETKTRQVVMNFIDNAMYYTPAGGKIEVEVRQDRSHAYFTVKDNGLGVPKDEQKHLFTKFYRAKNARSVRPDGTGLGLFMAKKVVTAQGGNILLESTEGKGSTFGFSLPLKTLRVES